MLQELWYCGKVGLVHPKNSNTPSWKGAKAWFSVVKLAEAGLEIVAGEELVEEAELVEEESALFTTIDA